MSAVLCCIKNTKNCQQLRKHQRRKENKKLVDRKKTPTFVGALLIQKLLFVQSVLIEAVQIVAQYFVSLIRHAILIDVCHRYLFLQQPVKAGRTI